MSKKTWKWKLVCDMSTKKMEMEISM